ncbi:MAG: UDP-N-acetylmuramoyl-L-alanine--D-glutamate ligase [Proteocatella sp.]
MQFKDMKVIVVGLGKSGFEILKFLDKKEIETIAFDSKENYDKDQIKKFSNKITINLGQNPTGEEACNLVVISPGVPTSLTFLEQFRKRGIEIVGEVEFAYNFAKGKFVSITGTNGKTTTTTLVGSIFKEAGIDTRIVGNIGNPIISEVETSTDETVFIAEISSFQLETINRFKSKAATVINVTPDHLDRHHTIGNYADIKSQIFKNQTQDDYAILNYDDEKVREMAKSINSKIIFFSKIEKLENGIYMEDGIIKISKNGISKDIVKRKDVFLKGAHNLENVMTAIGLSIANNIEMKIIVEALMNFKGVEHRLELVDTIDGVEYINDSKGTNADSSIKALETYSHDVILIAGGYDKKSEFDDFVKLFKGRVKHVILMGATRDKLAQTCLKFGFENYTLTDNMKEAVEIAKKIANHGDTVLLSPACASWGMYNNFEERGADFKENVRGEDK